MQVDGPSKQALEMAVGSMEITEKTAGLSLPVSIQALYESIL